jgi:hypothetical protein
MPGGPAIVHPGSGARPRIRSASRMARRHPCPPRRGSMWRTSRPLSARSSLTWCSANWRPTSRLRAETTRPIVTSCGRWSVVAAANWPALPARCTGAITTTSALAKPIPSVPAVRTSASPASSRPSNWMTWCGRIYARCSPIPSSSAMHCIVCNRVPGCPRSSRCAGRICAKGRRA